MAEIISPPTLYVQLLGSTRVIFNQSGTDLDRSDYYPTGERWADPALPATTNRWQYNGKERQTTGMPTTYSTYLDYGARMYDRKIGRWHTIDLMAEKYYPVSPYVYCLNNPIKFIDPDGRDGMVTGSGTKAEPYIITAKYFYKNSSINESGIKGLNAAINAYNSMGTVGVKDLDGSRIFVKYNLSAQGVDDVQKARSETKFDTKSGDVRYYGNIAGVESAQGDEFGSANNVRADYNIPNIETGIASGHDSESLYKGVMIHEIGHNLGGEHEHGTTVMDPVSSTENTSQTGGKTTSNSYPSTSNKFTEKIMQLRDTPKTESRQGRLWTPKQQ